ncbi:unnamed protein product [Lathyrus oleraceus]|nr:disease resistance protein RPP13-like [Pisum sativum]XP_050891886.1 disease resistance protein RPP13-like [Pisum sativum]
MDNMFIKNPVLSQVANRLSAYLIDEYAVLTGDVRQVEWIEKELRSMQGWLEHVEQHGYSRQEQALNEWADKLKDIALDAEDVIETFVMKSVKRRRWGFLYWNDKYKVGRELLQIRKRMRDISHVGINFNINFVNISIETTPPGEEVSSSATSGVVATAMQKLDHILSQTIVTGDEVIGMVEQVKGELLYLQNIVYSLKSISERENVWLKDVEKVCNDMKSIAQNFIVARERGSKGGKLEKVLYFGESYASEHEFKKRMKYIRTQIGDAFRRSLTYGVGEQLDKHTTPRSAALPDLSLDSLIIDGQVFSNAVDMGFLFVKLWRSVDKNLECVQRDLDLMRAFLRDTTAESEQGLNLNERQRVWICQVKRAAQNAHSLVDAYAKAGFLWGFISRRIKYAKDINCLLKEILSISHNKNIYGVANIQGTRQEFALATSRSPSIQEPQPVPAAASYIPLTGLKEKVQSMRAGLELMDALVQDVQDMGGELDRRSRIWVDQMEGIAIEARSIIEDYETKLEHKSLIFWALVKNKTWISIRNKIDNIKKKIDETWRRRKTYGLVQIQSRAMPSATVQILHGRTQPPVAVAAEKQSSIIGFDEDAQVLIAQLLSGERHHCITWIVGIGGTGKTTLAKLLFEDKAVVEHFVCRVWVSVPSTSNSNSNYMAQHLLEEIAKESAKQIKGTLSSGHVLEMAYKRYLIVVDGIEETNSQVYLLDTLKEAIPDMLTGSRLLLTARNANVDQHTAGTMTFIHPLQLLDDESSWLLFRRHLKVDNILQEELMKVGKKIVVKCGGLPSQILKMSDSLSHKENAILTHESSSVLNQIQDQIQSWSETLKTINTDLPLYLRRCLSYFGLFPDEFGIPVRRLVILWVAESLVYHSEEDEVTPEIVAERYLTELIHRNMVQVVARKRNGKVKTCRLPSALRQLWLTDSRSLDPKNSIIRRVADHLNSEDVWHNHIHGDTTSLRSSSLRTSYKDVLSFMSFDPQEGSKPGQQIGNFFKVCISSDCFLLLRVLDLERVYKPKLPKRIARLTRLRYLGLRWTYLESLPSSISKLLKLQTLDLKHTYIHTLPNSIWKMELRHLFLSETYRTRFPPQPKGNSLSNLQTLSGLFVDEETSVQGGLDNLVNVKKLGLACQSMSLQEEAMKKQLEAVADWITKLEHLQSLRLKSRDEQGKPWILHLNSFVNHTNLTDIYLLGSLNSSYVLSQFPLSLMELTLSHSKLEDDPMTLLKDFPNLRTLCLLAESYVGTTMVCESQSFPQLRVLKLWMLEQLDEWIIGPGTLPCLRQLEIRSCPRLKMLPDGLKHVNTLLELKLTNMPMEINADVHNIPPNCHIVQSNFQ